MALDLSISVDQHALDVARTRHVLETLRRVGYDGCALNHATSVPLRPKDVCKLPRIDLDAAPSAGGGQATDLVSSLLSDVVADRAGRKRKRGGSGSGHAVAAGVTPAGGAPRVPWRTLHRITVSVDLLSAPGATELFSCTAASVAAALLARGLGSGGGGGGGGGAAIKGSGAPPPASLAAEVLSSYDIVAMAPGDAPSFRAIIECGLADIVVLDVAGGRLPFTPSREDVAAALHAGLVFEVEYAPAIRDATARRFLLSNTQALLRLTKGGSGQAEGRGSGRGILQAALYPALKKASPLLITSGARGALELRSPADAAAILSLAGVEASAGRAGAHATPAWVLAHAEARLGGVALRPGHPRAFAQSATPPHFGAVHIHGGEGPGGGGRGGEAAPPKPFLATPAARGL